MAAATAKIPAQATSGCSPFESGLRVEVMASSMQGPCRRWTSKTRRSSLRLRPCNRHVLHQHRATAARTAHHEVAAGARDAAEHVAQVAGDGDFLHRVGDLALLHPVAGRAATIVAGHQVDAVAEELRDQQAAMHARQHAAKIQTVGYEHEVGIAARAARAAQTELARRVAAEEIAFEQPAAYHR